MSKGNKILLILVVVLGAVYFGNKYILSTADRNFRSTLVALDSAKISKIEIENVANNKELIILSEDENGWLAKANGIEDQADKKVIAGIKGSLVSLKPDRLVATSEDLWQENEVNDSLGTRVKVYANDDVIADFYVGKFNFQAASRSMSTNVRLADEVDVYAVEGYLSSIFNQSFDNFRDKTFLGIETDNLQTIKYIYPADSSFTLARSLQGWSINGMKADSTNTKNYIEQLARLSPRKFRNNFTAESLSPMYSLELSLASNDKVLVSVYKDEQGLVLHSSLNENAYFTNEGISVFEKLLVPLSKFTSAEK